jgi:hypothetical protein
VYSLNPAVTEMLTTDRLAEIHRQAAQCRRPRPASGRAGSLRRATGWALVEVGLRLAVPRRTIVGRPGTARRNIAGHSIDRRSFDRRQSAIPVAR